MSFFTQLGYLLFFMCILWGLVFAEMVFWGLKGRIFWRAMCPDDLRRLILPNDDLKMDGLMVLEEWVALLFFGSFLTFPFIMLDFLGWINLFH